MNIVVLPGDGVGRDVTVEVRRVLEALDGCFGLDLDLREFPCGGQYYLETGSEWPDEAFAVCRDWADAVFLGAVGWPGATLPSGDPAGKNVLFGLRLGLDLYANVRPTKLLPGIVQRVHERRIRVYEPSDVDLVIYRENTEGMYAPMRGILSRGGVEELAVDNRVVTRKGAERIIEAAFVEAERRAERRGRPAHVTCVDKSNVLDGCRLFRRVFHEVAERHPSVGTDCRFIDAFCQALLWEPRSFDVAVTTNLFGDVSSDVAAVLGGGLGMAPSAEVGDRWGLFEPVHGSAPPLAGKDRANPLGAILSAAMMLGWLGRTSAQAAAAARELEDGVAALLAAGETLPEDLGGHASCSAVGSALVAWVERRK